ncbi:MAG: hypothetical protein KDA86_07585 [Planctomycetaceae bacterium]|nr:hypothetical protein [Planctomycetaceae bacterium]
MSRSVQTGIFCPHCGQEIELRVGCRHQRLLTAIRLQAERLGTEIQCEKCRMGFIYTRVRPSRSSHLSGPHQPLSKAAARQL